MPRHVPRTRGPFPPAWFGPVAKTQAAAVVDAIDAISPGSATADGGPLVSLVTAPVGLGSAVASGSTVGNAEVDPVSPGAAIGAGGTIGSLVSDSITAADASAAGGAVVSAVVSPLAPGAAAADGAALSGVGDVVEPPPPPPEPGGGGRYEEGGDESAIFGVSARGKLGAGRAVASGGPLAGWARDRRVLDARAHFDPAGVAAVGGSLSAVVRVPIRAGAALAQGGRLAGGASREWPPEDEDMLVLAGVFDWHDS